MDENQLNSQGVSPINQGKNPASFLQEGVLFSALCLLAAIFNFASQSLFSHNLLPGEFGTLNAGLGIIGLFTVPLMAVNQALSHFLAHYDASQKENEIKQLRQAALAFLEIAALFLGVLTVLSLGLIQTVFSFPRSTLWTFSILAIAVALGSTVCSAFYLGKNQFRFWGGMLIAAALVRLLVGWGLTSVYPWAESGVVAVAAAGFVLCFPLLYREEFSLPNGSQIGSFFRPDFLYHFWACLSITLGLYLFTNGDQIIAQRWFGETPQDIHRVVSNDTYDAYQAAGLLGRALLWGSVPLLTVFYVQRSRSERTSAKALQLIWLYLAVLIGGAVALRLLGTPLTHVFPGQKPRLILIFIPPFALAMAALGVVQMIGYFCLASRRYWECHVFGLCGLGYAFLLIIGGTQPENMLALMFAGASLTTLAVFFVGLVRWSRVRK